ncbi:hypothetical protein NU195Hw_g5968t1 [Hortaea werneckii]
MQNWMQSSVFELATIRDDQNRSTFGKLNGKMRTAIKQLATGRLTGPSVFKKTGVGPPTHVPVKRSRSITPKLSVSTLLHKASLPQINKLKKKPSETTLIPSQPDQLSSRPSFDLTVTDFEQTPFVQRYGNTLRAEHNRIRNLVDATLDDDHNDEELVQLGFEFDKWWQGYLSVAWEEEIGSFFAFYVLCLEWSPATAAAKSD